jgi:hypothetical protein
MLTAPQAGKTLPAGRTAAAVSLPEPVRDARSAEHMPTSKHAHFCGGTESCKVFAADCAAHYTARVLAGLRCAEFVFCRAHATPLIHSSGRTAVLAPSAFMAILQFTLHVAVLTHHLRASALSGMTLSRDDSQSLAFLFAVVCGRGCRRVHRRATSSQGPSGLAAG